MHHIGHTYLSIVRPSLTDWTEQHLANIYASTTQTDFDDAFDSFISRDCPHITVNGEPYTREDFKHALQDQKRDESWCKMKIKHAIESPTDSYHPREAGTVSIAYEALINVLHPQGSFNHTGHPQHRDVNSSLNLVISEDPTVRPEHQTCRGECCDIRRVSAIDQVLMDVTEPGFVPHPTSRRYMS